MSRIAPMPWPVTHILTAEIFYKPHFSHLDYKKFILGTCFPDIRYPAKLPRKNTHIKNLTLSEIQSQSAFQAGLYFHSYIDELWNAIVLNKNKWIFNEIPHDQAMIHAMKSLQDKCLYSQSTNWESIANYFNTILLEEGTFGVSKALVTHWHSMLGDYLRKQPSIHSLDMLSISLSPDMVKKIGEYYRIYQNNHALNHILFGFYEQVSQFHQASTHALEPFE